MVCYLLYRHFEAEKHYDNSFGGVFELLSAARQEIKRDKSGLVEYR